MNLSQQKNSKSLIQIWMLISNVMFYALFFWWGEDDFVKA